MLDTLGSFASQLAAVLGPLLLRLLDWVGGLVMALVFWLGDLYLLAVHAWLPHEYAAILGAPSARSVPLFVLMMAGMIWLRVWSRGLGRRKAASNDKCPLRQRRQPLYRRLKLWWVHKLDQPYYWKIGKHVANLNQTHGLVVGGSGSGKSTLVVSLILQPAFDLKTYFLRRWRIWQKRPVLIISFDRSDPIEEVTNVLEDAGIPVTRWRVRQTSGWDMLQGDAEMIAEALPTGWPSGDNTGFFQQLATDAISAALYEQDVAGVPRHFADMIERMDAIMDADPETPDLARRTWVRRFRSLARVMGESIGDDFDLVTALKPNAVVHLSSNSYTNPALTPLVGAMAITHTKLVADKIPGGGYLVIEEASFLKKRADILDDLAKSMRARGWRIIYLNQDPCAVGDALQVNFGVAVFMGLGPLAVKAREWCANVVKDFPGSFRAAELVLGATIDQLEGYVLLAGRCRDVSLAPYITRAAVHRPAVGRPRPVSAPAFEIRPEVGAADAGPESPASDLSEAEAFLDLVKHQPHRVGPVPVPEWVTGRRLRAEQRDRARLNEIWAEHVFPYGVDGCYETTYAVNQEGSNGRPRCGYMGQSWLVYALVLAVRDGLDLDVVREEMKAKTRSADHKCENNRCVRLEHLRWLGSAGANSAVYHERRRDTLRLLTAAD